MNVFRLLVKKLRKNIYCEDYKKIYKKNMNSIISNIFIFDFFKYV